MAALVGERRDKLFSALSLILQPNAVMNSADTTH